MTPAEVETRLDRARAWYASRGRTPFEFQESMWRAYWAGESGLLNATTGTGKTLAAWMGPLLEASSRRIGSHPRRRKSRVPLSASGCSGTPWGLTARHADSR